MSSPMSAGNVSDVSVIFRGLNHNMPRNAANLKMQACFCVGPWRSNALEVFHLSTN